MQIKLPSLWNSNEDQQAAAIQSMKQNIEIMNQVYKNFYAVYSSALVDKLFWQPYISCELIVEKELIKFVLWVPGNYYETFENIISSFYPGAVTDAVTAPRFLDAWKYMKWGSFTLMKGNEFPIKMYESFEADPMDSIIASYARVGMEEWLGMQILVTPLHESRQEKMRKKWEKLKKWKKSLFKKLGGLFGSDEDKPEDEKNSKYSQQQLWDIDKKAEDEWFGIVIRAIAVSPLQQRPKIILDDLKRSLTQYNYVGLNGFSYHEDPNQTAFAKRYVQRLFIRPYLKSKKWLFGVHKQILNIKELSGIYHFPYPKFNKNPRIVRQKFKIVPAPDGLPDEWILLGYNVYWWVKKEIKLTHGDRFRHFYIIGQTGTGKSTILRTMLNQDMAAWRGFTLIDPHGDLAEACLEYFPKDRIEDLVYRDAAQTEYPFGFNILRAEWEEEMDAVTNDAVDMFVQLYGSEIFGPRIQDFFRNAVLLLMEQPDWWSLVEIMRLFTDEAFLKSKLVHLKNPVIRSRWEKTYGSMADREKKEMIPYFQAKFGPLTTTPILRNIIGQNEPSFDIGEIMDTWKVLIMNLSKGRLWDINSNMLWMMIVSQIRLAAFRRASIPEHERVPHFLYIDEFQNFVTPSIESILSEARKYKLWLILAHQYMAQLETQGSAHKGAVQLKDPILWNVWNTMCYRIWVDDSDIMEKQFGGKFSKSDLTNLDKFKGAIKMSVNMQPTEWFSIKVKLPWEDPALNTAEKVEVMKKISALKYGRKKEIVEKEVFYKAWA